MGFSIYNLFKAGLLIGNGAAILHPKRFLAQHGLAGEQIQDNPDPVKAQIAGLLQAVSYLKVPLIVCNILVILVEVLAGG